MKIEKKHEGQAIWGVPTRNNFNRYGNAGTATEQAVEFRVVKVNRRYAVLERVKSTSQDSYDRDTGATQSAVSSGHDMGN